LVNEGSDGELDEVFQASAGAILVRKTIKPQCFISIQVKLGGVWKEYWNRAAVSKEPKSMTVPENKACLVPDMSATHDIEYIPEVSLPGHLRRFFCPVCKRVVAEGVLLCSSCKSGFKYEDVEPSDRARVSGTPSAAEAPTAVSSDSEVVMNLSSEAIPSKARPTPKAAAAEGEPQPLGRKRRHRAAHEESSASAPGVAMAGVSPQGTQGTEGLTPAVTPHEEEPSPGDETSEVARYNSSIHKFKTKIMQLYRHSVTWDENDEYRKGQAQAGKVRVRNRPVRDDAWSGNDEDRKDIDIKLTASDFMMYVLVNVLWLLNVPSRVKVVNLYPTPLAFMMLFCGLDAAQAMSIMVAKTRPDKMLAQLTQLFLDTHANIPVTKAFGDIIAGQRSSVMVFSDALAHTMKEIHSYKSFHWVTEANPNLVDRSSAKMAQDLRFPLERQAVREQNLGPPRTKARGAASSASGMLAAPKGTQGTSGGASSSSGGAVGPERVSGTQTAAGRTEAPPSIFGPPKGRW